MRDSPYYLKPLDKKKDIERYSDKYQLSNHDNGVLKIGELNLAITNMCIRLSY